MPEPSKLHELSCDLVLNGMPVRSVQIRNTPNSPDFEIVITDPTVGCFALHAGFEIDVRESDSAWRRVSVDELKRMLNRSALWAIPDLPKASEVAEHRLFARVDDIRIPHSESTPRSVLGRQDACVRYVQRIFYRVGIPHLIAGTTFTVPSAPTARIPLKRAGFRQSEISPTALLEPRTGCTIQLIERDPRK